jgi:hypothetical protein
MSKILIDQYYQNLDRTLQYGKSSNETSIRNHFWNLLNAYSHKLNYELITEVAVMGTRGKKVYPDGVVKNLCVLDQYKEMKSKDPTIAGKFNTYRFADYKEHVIDLLQRVCTVSVETMNIIRQMEEIDTVIDKNTGR